MGDQRRTCFGLGGKAYPSIEWNWDEFVIQWDARGESTRTIAANQDDYVRLACLANRPGAWEVLDSDYLQPLLGSIQRVSPTRSAADLALQQLRCLLTEPTSKLAAYRPVGSFRAWLRVVAVRTALESSRQERARSSREDELTDRLQSLTPGPEARYASEEMKAELRRALRSAAARLPADERHALHLHLVAKWNITQIGRTLSMHRSTAARLLVSAKQRLRAELKEELSSRRRSSLEDTGEGWSELLSHVDLTLTRIFPATGAPSSTESTSGRYR